jgi:hypothetical protein
MEGHAHKCHGLALARGDEHVHLTTGAGRGDIFCEAQKAVSLFAHSGNNEHYLVAVPDGPRNMLCNGTNAIRVADRCTAKFLYK